MKYKFILKINNRQGLIARIALILERRGYAITSLFITSSGVEDWAKMDLVITGESSRKDQIIKQLTKLIDVVEIDEVKELKNIQRLFNEFVH